MKSCKPEQDCSRNFINEGLGSQFETDYEISWMHTSLAAINWRRQKVCKTSILKLFATMDFMRTYYLH